MCPFSKNNHLARCLVSGVTDGRDNGRNNSAWLCWGLLVQVDQGCPRLRWAMVDHGSQLASSRRSLCQVQKLSYSCVSRSALKQTASPYCWHVQQSCLLVSVCQFSKKDHLARCLVSGVADGRDNSRKLRPAMLALAGSSRPGVPEAALGHGRSW